MKVTPMRHVTFATIGLLGIAAISALAQAPPVDPATGGAWARLQPVA